MKSTNSMTLAVSLTFLSALSGINAQTDRPAATVRPSTRHNLSDLQIRGRVQAQFGMTDADNDADAGTYSTFEIRRARIGLRGTLFENVRAQLEANLVPGSDLSMRSAFLEWREHKAAYIKLGYDKPRFSFEENTSSAEILTVERTAINNMLVPGAQNGLSLAGGIERLSYAVGVYTDRNNRNADGDNSYLVNASAGLSLDELFASAKLRLRADYLASDDDGGNFGGKFDDAMAVSLHYALNRFDLRTEYMTGDNDGNSVNGFYVTPSVFVTDNVQLVGRFEMAESDKARGIRAPGRYMQRADGLGVVEADADAGIAGINPQRGDEYTAFYVGANYYMNGNNHKIMTGVEVAELANTDAGTLSATTAYCAWRMLF